MQLQSGVAPSRLRRARKNLLCAGTALVAIFGISSAVQAQCVLNGTTGIPGFDPVVLALGGSGAAAANALNSVLSTVNTAYLTQSTAFVSAPGNPQPYQQGGGVWARGIGGRIDVESTGNSNNFSFAGAPLPGSLTCQTTTRQEFAGFQVGADISRLNIGGTNLHFGVTAGYAESEARDISPGGTFRGNFQIPFAGLYFAMTHGNFFADAQVRFDFYQNDITDPAVGLAFGRRFDAQGISVTGNIGYRWDLGNGWFLEPSTGIVVSRTEVDPIFTPGTIFGPAFGLPALPSVLRIDDIESALGRLSLRVGTNFVANNIAWQPFFTASVFHEFADDTIARVTDDPSVGIIIPAFAATISSERVGTYGQFALGIAGQIVNTGWLGYIRGDYRIGENIEGFSLNGGLRYQFTPQMIAAAAPLVTKGPALKAPPRMVAPAPHNWTGFYIGAQAGAIWGESEWTYVGIGTRTRPDYQGVLAGGQAGFNYQLGSVVFGVEGDGAWSNAAGGAACPNGLFFNCEDELSSFYTLRGRLGFAFDRTLLYVTGGLAAADVRSQTVEVTGAPVAPSGTPTNGSDRTAVGWTVGAGFEFALTSNWSAKGEFLYYDLGTERHTVDNLLLVDVDRHGGLGRVGVNYKFGPMAAPVVARY